MVGIRDNTVTPTIARLYYDGNHNTQIGDDSAISDYGSVLDSARTHITASIALLHAHSSPTPIPDSERVDGVVLHYGRTHPFLDLRASILEMSRR